MQFGTNHLGHVALTGLLLDSLPAWPGAQVVTVSIQVARMGRASGSTTSTARRYDKWATDAQTKLANHCSRSS